MQNPNNPPDRKTCVIMVIFSTEDEVGAVKIKQDMEAMLAHIPDVRIDLRLSSVKERQMPNGLRGP